MEYTFSDLMGVVLFGVCVGILISVIFRAIFKGDESYDKSLERQSEDRIIRELTKQNRKINDLMFRIGGGEQCTTGVLGYDMGREQSSSGENVTPRPDPSYEVNDEGELIERN